MSRSSFNQEASFKTSSGSRIHEGARRSLHQSEDSPWNWNSLGTRTLLGAPGRTTRSILATSNKKLLHATRDKEDWPKQAEAPGPHGLTNANSNFLLTVLQQYSFRTWSDASNLNSKALVSISFLLLLVRHLFLVAWHLLLLAIHLLLNSYRT